MQEDYSMLDETWVRVLVGIVGLGFLGVGCYHITLWTAPNVIAGIILGGTGLYDTVSAIKGKWWFSLWNKG